MRILALLVALLLAPFAAQLAAQDGERTTPVPPPPQRPPLVVLISVDQLRADYLSRFDTLFGEGGFRRLMEQGAWFPDARLPYTLSFTAVSHAAIATGCNPSSTGIVGNAWYDPDEDRKVYAVEDSEARILGSADGIATAGRSLKLLERPTLGDAMQAHFGDASMVLSFSIKDRSALMLGGKQSDGSYWIDGNTGTWITSSRVSGEGAHLTALPDWVVALNRKQPLLKFAGEEWQRVISDAAASDLAGPDDAPGEPTGKWPDRTFPHEIPSVEDVTEGMGADQAAPHISRLVKYSPYGDRAVYDAAKRALAATELGRDAVPDLLALGFSSLDYVGHVYGPDSVEVLEMVVALDRLLAELFQQLDMFVGKGRWVLALTSDHGIPPLPEQSGGRRMPSGLAGTLDEKLRRSFGVPPHGAGPSETWVLNVSQPGVTLNHAAAKAKSIPIETLAGRAAELLRKVPGISHASPRSELLRGQFDDWPPAVTADLHPTRSADVHFLLEKNAMFGLSGTTHGTHHDNDSRVPLIFLGKMFAAVHDVDGGGTTDIAPTLAAYLGIELLTKPDGRVLTEAYVQPNP